MVRTLDRAERFDGEAFAISGVRKVRRSGYEMTTLDGGFNAQQVLESAIRLIDAQRRGETVPAHTAVPALFEDEVS